MAVRLSRLKGKSMKIAVDAMGGDQAPLEIVKGAFSAVKELDDIEVVLVGDEQKIKSSIAELNVQSDNISIFHASEVVAMDEPATYAVRKKKDSSITRCAGLVSKGEAEAVVSAGNTGAAVAASMVCMRTLEGVKRPGIGIFIPTMHGSCMVIDAGANISCKPLHFLQYGVMASVYCESVLNIEKPTVGLLNVGEEDAKGNDLVKEAFGLLSNSSLNFVGNVEGREIFDKDVNIVVCEGFVGNILLKFFEGLTEDFLSTFRTEAKKDPETSRGLSLCEPVLKSILNRSDYSEYGGVPLLGVNGISIISHGRSDAKAIHNAIKAAMRISKYSVNEHIVEELKNNGCMEVG